MKLVVVHFHFRPGGVRRVIELATPHLVRAICPPVSEVVLVGGEAPDRLWLDRFRELLAPVPVVVRVLAAGGYLAEQRRWQVVTLGPRLRAFIGEILGDAGAKSCLVWAHNQGLGRNLLLTGELVHTCGARGIPLVLHHHDWWFDNRWRRWPEMRRGGFRTLARVAETVFASRSNVRHAAINQVDTAILQRHLPRQAGWLPNPAGPESGPPAARVRAARVWLRRQLGEDAPIWLMPCRLLRRKNIAEALLLTRWLRPEAWLVTTGGVSSADERAYAGRLATAVRRHGWRLRLGVLQDDERARPAVPELVAASESLLLTSLQEGFGLPYLEAAAAGRPLIARALPNIAPDLARFGFHFPQSYDEVLVDSRLFDWSTEVARQRRLFRAWRRNLPAACRDLTSRPQWLAACRASRPVPFSRLTLTAQLEVLAKPLSESWELCAPLNPYLRTWRHRAANRSLRVTPWPPQAARWLDGDAYARRFCKILDAAPERPAPRSASHAAQEEFMRKKVALEYQYPLLWNRDI